MSLEWRNANLKFHNMILLYLINCYQQWIEANVGRRFFPNYITGTKIRTFKLLLKRRRTMIIFCKSQTVLVLVFRSVTDYLFLVLPVNVTQIYRNDPYYQDFINSCLLYQYVFKLNFKYKPLKETSSI